MKDHENNTVCMDIIFTVLINIQYRNVPDIVFQLTSKNHCTFLIKKHFLFLDNKYLISGRPALLYFPIFLIAIPLFPIFSCIKKSCIFLIIVEISVFSGR